MTTRPPGSTQTHTYTHASISDPGALLSPPLHVSLSGCFLGVREFLNSLERLSPVLCCVVPFPQWDSDQIAWLRRLQRCVACMRVRSPLSGSASSSTSMIIIDEAGAFHREACRDKLAHPRLFFFLGLGEVQ